MELCGPPSSVSNLQLTVVLLSGRGAIQDVAEVEQQPIAMPFMVDSYSLGLEEAPGQQHKGMLMGQPASPGCSWLHAVLN